MNEKITQYNKENGKVNKYFDFKDFKKLEN